MCMRKKKDISWKDFSFLVYQRSVQLLYETLDTSIGVLVAFTVRVLAFSKQTGKIQGSNTENHYLGRKNNGSDYRRPN